MLHIASDVCKNPAGANHLYATLHTGNGRTEITRANGCITVCHYPTTTTYESDLCLVGAFEERYLKAESR